MNVWTTLDEPHKWNDRSPSQNDEGQAGEPGGGEEHLHLQPRVDARDVDEGEGEDRLEEEGEVEDPAKIAYNHDITTFSEKE